jgi:hypothetical protein
LIESLAKGVLSDAPIPVETQRMEAILLIKDHRQLKGTSNPPRPPFTKGGSP